MDYLSPTTKHHLNQLLQMIEERRRSVRVFPPQELILRALHQTPLDQVNVVILGQDPYHQPGQADGLAFSSNTIPKSLHNIFRELHDDLGITPPSTGRLDGWATQGVLLLNRILSVEESKPLSHQEFGWQAITNEIIQTISSTKAFVVFVLWGAYAQEVTPLIDSRHLILTSPHPSPLSAYRGFFGSKPFSRINQALGNQGITPIDWASFS
jgi:uracil-DNA glycosylase